MWQGFQGIGGQAGLPRAPAPRFVIPAPHFVMPAPHFVMPAPHFVIPAKAGIQRGGGECGKASRASEAKPASQERRPPDSSFVIPAPHFVMPAPHFVIPAKAGIQRGGEECGKASRASEAKPACQERRPPTSSFRRRPESRGAVRSVARRFVMPAPHFVIPAPHFVIPAKAGIQRGGEGRIRHGGPSLNAAPKLLPHP